MKSPRLNLSGRQNLLRVLGTCFALALLVYVLGEQGWKEILLAFQQIAPWRLAAALILMFISRLAVSARWVVLLRSAGVPVTTRQGLRINFAGLFANNFLPTTIGGDVVRLAGAVQLGFDAAVSTASLIVDRLVGMAGMAMTVPFGLSSVLRLAAAQNSLSLNPKHVISGTAVTVFGKFWQKGTQIAQRVLAALSLWLKKPRALFAALVCSWVNMLCLFLVLYLLFQGMGQDIPFGLVAGLYSIVYFVTLLPVSVNGYGLQELSMTLIFSKFGGATAGSCLTAALLFRTLMMIASLPGVFFVPEMIAEVGQRKPSAG
jgi:uncharacterized membrane protein YbhN (UPF0104 family)